MVSEAFTKRSVLAFDGDNTLWIDNTHEQQWERHFKDLRTASFPTSVMASGFCTRIREYGYSIVAVRKALLETADRGPERMSDSWRRQVEALPQVARELKLEPAPGIHGLLTKLSQDGHELWIITKGDFVRQAIKLACFPAIGAFSVIEIVSKKSAVTYKQILADRRTIPADFAMVGDRLRDDILPPLLIGARAAYMPSGRWQLLAPMGRVISTNRFLICRKPADISRIAGWGGRGRARCAATAGSTGNQIGS